MRDLQNHLHEEHFDELLDRYFVGTLSQEDSELLRVQLQRAGVDLNRLEQLRTAWATPWKGRHTADEWVERIRKQLPIAAESSANQVQPGVAAPPRFRTLTSSRSVFSWGAWRYAFYGVVATLLVVVGAWQLQERSEVAPKESYSSYTTGNGERATITLPDGTIVRLNVGSHLLVPATYSSGNRTVQLTGEAMFSVMHRSDAPFTVVAGPSTTRVLGTTFVVRHYETDSTATVTVRDGKVAVGTTVVSALQQVTVGARGVSELHPADQKRFAFAEGVLMLGSMPLVEAVPELNRWYDADIRLGDKVIQQQRIVGGFKAGSITDLVSILEMTYNVRVEREGRVLTLYTRGQ
jgi:ferric-dicitrate binding protein FerR (iron transport regulator)